MLENNRLYCGDSVDLLRRLDDGSVDLVVTSPPYDDLRKYNGSGNAWNHEKFLEVAKELYRVVKDGGVVVWNVYDKTENGSKSGTSLRQCLSFQEIGFNINDYMIWRKTNPMPVVKQPRYNPCFEFMWVLSKGKPKTFNPIKVPCKCAGQNYDSTCKNMGGENGRTHKTFNINNEKTDCNIWDMAVAQNKTEHPAVFPYELAYRHVISWSNDGDVVLDPFVGSGTTMLAALQTNRNYIGFDISEKYIDIANGRLNEVMGKDNNDIEKQTITNESIEIKDEPKRLKGYDDLLRNLKRQGHDDRAEILEQFIQGKQLQAWCKTFYDKNYEWRDLNHPVDEYVFTHVATKIRIKPD